ncbi:hypothetical protein HZH68_007494 [Vespula germanica]|uniref:Uncharacterized protein n=1 Tax=Vespula germanica TaxID=30212 RepID=A0A834NB54_VESGE|nr:hypothetical protein HZH68_007494 [Vespula germanica]
MPKRKLHYVVTANWSKGWLQTEMESVVGRRLYSTSLVGYDDTTGCREPFAEATGVLARECFSSPGDQRSDIPKLTDLEKREEEGEIRRRDITRTTLQSKGFMAQTEIPQTMAELIP